MNLSRDYLSNEAGQKTGKSEIQTALAAARALLLQTSETKRKGDL